MIARNRSGAERVAPSLLFAPMRREDLAEVLAIERSSFAQPWTAEFFLQELRLPFSRVFLARAPLDSGRPVIGYVCRWLTVGELHILNVAVHPDWRRREVGRSLVDYVIAEAKRAGAERATLEVRRHNLPALTLYERLGFREVGIRRNYYGPGEDALLMERRFDGE